MYGEEDFVACKEAVAARVGGPARRSVDLIRMKVQCRVQLQKVFLLHIHPPQITRFPKNFFTPFLFIPLTYNAS